MSTRTNRAPTVILGVSLAAHLRPRRRHVLRPRDRASDLPCRSRSVGPLRHRVGPCTCDPTLGVRPGVHRRIDWFLRRLARDDRQAHPARRSRSRRLTFHPAGAPITHNRPDENRPARTRDRPPSPCRWRSSRFRSRSCWSSRIRSSSRSASTSSSIATSPPGGSPAVRTSSRISSPGRTTSAPATCCIRRSGCSCSCPSCCFRIVFAWAAVVGDPARRDGLGDLAPPPRPEVWPLLALCVAWPTTLLKTWTGNPVIWASRRWPWGRSGTGRRCSCCSSRASRRSPCSGRTVGAGGWRSRRSCCCVPAVRVALGRLGHVGRQLAGRRPALLDPGNSDAAPAAGRLAGAVARSAPNPSDLERRPIHLSKERIRDSSDQAKSFRLVGTISIGPGANVRDTPSEIGRQPSPSSEQVSAAGTRPSDRTRAPRPPARRPPSTARRTSGRSPGSGGSRPRDLPSGASSRTPRRPRRTRTDPSRRSGRGPASGPG